MGLFSSSKSTTTDPASSEPLQAVSKGPIGVVQAFATHDQPINLQLQEKRVSITGDSFFIKDASSDQPVLEIKAKSFSLHTLKEFVDLQGQTLFRLRKKVMALNPTVEALSPDDDAKVLFTVKKGFTLGKTKLSVTFRNAADGEDMSLALRGNFTGRSATITLGTEEGPVVGRISRDSITAKQVVSNTQMYFLTVAPGVDAAMLAAVCVILYEMEYEAMAASGGAGGAST